MCATPACLGAPLSLPNLAECASHERMLAQRGHETCLPASSLQFSIQYRVAEDRLYDAFYSLADPEAQVTSYGGEEPLSMRACSRHLPPMLRRLV